MLTSVLITLYTILRPVAYNLISCAYPILASAKAVVQEDRECCSEWTTYWVVWSVLSLFESCMEWWLVSWLPLYAEIKLLFICWLVLPRYQGAAVLYERVIEPYFLEYEEQLDEHIHVAHDTAKRHIWSFFVYLLTEGSKMVGEQTRRTLTLALRVAGLSSANDEVDLGRNMAAAVSQAAEGAYVAAEKWSSSELARSTECIATKMSVDDIERENIGNVRHARPEETNMEENEEEEEEEQEQQQQQQQQVYNEEDAALLEDFQELLQNGVYLNISSRTHAAPRLRLLTVSDDRWRLLWSNLRDLRSQQSAASSLHLLTILRIAVPRPLCVSLSTYLDEDCVTFEAQDDEVHNALSAGLQLVVADAKQRSGGLFSTLSRSFRGRLLESAMQSWKAI